MPVKPKRGKKKEKSKSMDDLSVNTESTARHVLVKRMASTSLSSDSRRKQEDGDEWGVGSTKRHSSPWLSKTRVCCGRVYTYMNQFHHR